MLCLLSEEQGPQNEVRDEDEGLIFTMFGAYERKHVCTFHGIDRARGPARPDRLCQDRQDGRASVLDLELGHAVLEKKKIGLKGHSRR